MDSIAQPQLREDDKSDSTELVVTYRATAELKPHLRNARTHSKRQIRQIADSIQAFGFTSPILIDKAGTIIASHGRVAAAKLLGIERVPTIQLDGLSEDQIRAYLIADNKLGEKAGWDDSILAIELQHLMTIEGDFEVTATGFEIPEIDLLLSPAKAKPKDDPDDEFEDDQAVAPVTQPGDLWKLGRHRIFSGTALEELS